MNGLLARGAACEGAPMKHGVAILGIAAWLGSACISPVIPIGSGSKRNAKEAQQANLGKLLPAQLTANTRWSGTVRTAKIRVWADEQYRAQNLRWEHGFDEQLAYVNAVLTPMVGLRLVADYRTWEHRAPDASLEDHLAVLRAQDAGDDVSFVVGLTSSLSATFHLLGLAELGDRHLVLRGHADLEERKVFERAFPSLDAEERDEVLEARRRHKTATVLVHELAHAMGALHDNDAGGVMDAAYTDHAASIGDRNRELMLITLEDRLKPAARRDPGATANALIAAIERGNGPWLDEDRDQALAQLRAQAGRGALQATTGSPEPAISAGLDPAVAAAIKTASAKREAGDVAGAREALVAAAPALQALSGPAATEAWLAIAAQYQAMGALTWTDEALVSARARPGATHGIGSWAQTTRVRYGIPRNAERWKLAPEDEASAVAAVRGVLALITANQLDAASRAETAAEHRWPRLPGLLAMRCDVELRRNALAKARAACDRAIEQGASSWALYLLGVIELRAPSVTATWAAVARLRAAIDLDPELAQAWRALAKALERGKADAQLEQLRRDYRTRFHDPLTVAE
jgi:hypothetical protein